MTKDEAIKIIEDACWWYHKKGCTGLTQAEIFEARDRAIEALETATVIEQIRDEIEENITDYILDEEDTNTAIRMGDVMTKVFEIIDKYREEQTDAT